VADEIRGVPFPLQNTWMDNAMFKKWYQTGLASTQMWTKPDACDLYFLAKDTALRSKKNRERSAMLYENKMKNDMEPKRVETCAVHPNHTGPGKMGPWIPLGKLARKCVCLKLIALDNTNKSVTLQMR
jgi:hypothetical protein